MAMGTRRKRERQQDLWIAATDVVQTPANAFYDRLNQMLDEHKFDGKVERLCRKFYKQSPYGSAQHGARRLLSLSSDRLFRGPGLGTRDRLADGRFPVPAEVSGIRAGRGNTGSFHDFAHPPFVLAGDA